jgi:hypothetical protein
MQSISEGSCPKVQGAFKGNPNVFHEIILFKITSDMLDLQWGSS